jgi:hypothetical protein
MEDFFLELGGTLRVLADVTVISPQQCSRFEFLWSKCCFRWIAVAISLGGTACSSVIP